METTQDPFASINRNAIIGRNMIPSEWWKRLLTYVVDYIIVFILCIVLFIVLNLAGVMELGGDSADTTLKSYGIGFLVLLVYYIVFEHFTGKTIGKMIFKTKVINTNGSKPSLSQIMGRTFSRIIPFEIFSFISANPKGWHDSIPGTMVVNDIDLYNFNTPNVAEEEQY